MAGFSPCTDCGNNIPPSAERCPHCGRPGLFPNVRAAQAPEERDTLQKRYQAAVNDADARGAGNVLKDFETATTGSQAVICRSMHEISRLASSENELYSTYYRLADAEVRMPSGEKWDALRTVADAALFTNYADKLRFACLTLTGEGLTNYGACSLLLRTDMIAHRASVMDENSTMLVKHHKIEMGEAEKVPKGYRAVWDERQKLCVAKLAGRIDAGTQPDKYSAILLWQGKGSEDDDFVEVQIWGPMTIRTVEQVALNHRANKAERAIYKGIKEQLDRFGVRIR